MMENVLNDKILKIIKNKEILFIFQDFNLEFGGLGGSVINRANYLSNKGYSVTLLNLDEMINFDYICNEFRKLGVFSKNVKFINVYDYYSKKNCVSNNPKYILTLDNQDYFLEQICNDDESIILNYYNDESLKILVKSELYINNVLVSRKFQDTQKTEYYTYDGFNYLERIRSKNFVLHTREEDSIRFEDITEFMYYFMDEMCRDYYKPFLVCDSTSHFYNMNNVKEEVYKIGVMHGNPYVLNNEPIDHISPLINHLSHLDDLDVLVVLTNEVKQDLINEFNQDKFVIIPNVIQDEIIETELTSKDFNKIGIFSRISSEKQMADAINAFKIVSDVKPEAILEIYGRAFAEKEKIEQEKLMNLVKELNLEEKVLFKGFFRDVNLEMQKSLFTLLISKHEGLPFALLESMANATPVMCYNFKYGPKDVITDGIDGVIVEKGNINQLANKMIELLDDPQKAVKMGFNARNRIKSNFSVSNIGYKWEKLLQDVFINSTLDELNKLSKDLNESNNLNKELNNKNVELKNENKELKIYNKKLKKFNDSVVSSKSWKLTAPLRKIVLMIKNFLN